MLKLYCNFLVLSIVFIKKTKNSSNTDPRHNNDLVRLSYLNNQGLGGVGGGGIYKPISLGKNVKFTNSTGKMIFLIMTGESDDGTNISVHVGTGAKENAAFVLDGNGYGTQRGTQSGMGTLVLKNGDWFYYEGMGRMIYLFQVS